MRHTCTCAHPSELELGATRYDPAILADWMQGEGAWCRPNLRLPNASWINQILDQIFSKLKYHYRQTTNAMKAIWEYGWAEKQLQLPEAQRAATKAVWKMDKQKALIVLCALHRGGVCRWMPVDVALEAWTRVGVTQAGVFVGQLLQHPDVTGLSVAAASPSRAAAPPGFPQPSNRVPPWVSPEKKPERGTPEFED